MKANGAPEKIYCTPTEGGFYLTTIKPEPPFAEGVEYIQTDAFIEEAISWLMFFKEYYVMPFPRPYYKWEVVVIILGKPNTQDGKLNMAFLDGKYNSYDEALIGGVEQVLLTLVEAKKDADSHAGDDEYTKKLVDECRENGFDI